MNVIDVVHVITGLETGGAEQMLQKLVLASDRRRFRHTVVSLRGDGPIGRSLREHAVRVMIFGQHSRTSLPRALVCLVHLLRSERPHIVQTWLYDADFVGTLAAVLARTPRLAWNIRSTQVQSRVGKIARPILGLASRIPDAVLINSMAGRAAHERLGYRPRVWEWVPNGFDTARFRPDREARARIRAELGLADDDAVIVNVGSFRPVKGHRYLLRAMADVLHSRSAYLVLAGRGLEPGNADLAALLSDDALRRHVRLLGDRRDIASILAAGDIFVSASLMEAFPNAVGEAMSCALPCVVTDVGDCALILGGAGIVVAAADHVALAGGIRSLLSDAPERGRLGALGRERVADLYSIGRVVERYESIYERLAANS